MHIIFVRSFKWEIAQRSTDKEQTLVDMITQEHSSARSSKETTGANPNTEACPGKFFDKWMVTADKGEP